MVISDFSVLRHFKFTFMLWLRLILVSLVPGYLGLGTSYELTLEALETVII